ncbi:hypothetical protein CEXT_650571 [Caerostris extrusa]|uniref:Uncharacterized protein n=1 Tax=Caerostris extrusa TaxID=172846 RepID=A0AAV4PX36_CAEEX|nr:hypothetical protein CEXT_650571 [Caerostris extrusa]
MLLIAFGEMPPKKSQQDDLKVLDTQMITRFESLSFVKLYSINQSSDSTMDSTRVILTSIAVKDCRRNDS